MWFADVILLGEVYLITLLWQLIAFPWIEKLFPTLIDRGWAMGRVLTMLLIAWIIFGVANLGLPVNTNEVLWLMTLVLGVVSAVKILKERKKWRVSIREILAWIIVEEILFLTGLMFMGIMRGFWPNLDNLEKMMDFGFINQYLLSPKLPATDMAFSGGAINYYSFGHFWASEIIRWLVVKPSIGFNLVLAFFFGLDLILSFSVIVNLISKIPGWKKVVAGALGGVLVCLGGNSHILWFMVKNHGLWEGDAPYWYALATRFIGQTIHEFPAYTFAVGDLHADLIDLSVVLSFLLVLVAWNKTVKKKIASVRPASPAGRLEVLMGGLLGIMVMTNTWDSLVYGLLLLVFLVLKRSSMRMSLTIFGIAILVASPWWWSFKPMTQGIKWVTERSPLWQLLVIWSGQLLFGMIAWMVTKKNVIIRSLVMTALMLIAIPEIVYWADIYITYPRANTMFKLTYQAFVMLSLLGGVAIGETFNRKSRPVFCLLILVIVGLLVYPWTAYPNFYLNFREYHGLDGEIWLREKVPDKYGAILYLKNHRDGKNLLEYPGKSFSLSNATPVFSGVPTVLGWRDHEWLWRNDDQLIDNRTRDIQTVYTKPGSEAAKKIIEKY